MKRLIVNAPSGEQKLLSIELSGQYFDLARVIWDERVDGLINPVALQSLGGLERQGNSLVVNAQLLAAHQAAVAAAAQAASDRATRINQAKNFLRNLDTSANLSAAQQLNFDKAVIVLLKDLYASI